MVEGQRIVSGMQNILRLFVSRVGSVALIFGIWKLLCGATPRPSLPTEDDLETVRAIASSSPSTVHNIAPASERTSSSMLQSVTGTSLPVALRSPTASM